MRGLQEPEADEITMRRQILDFLEEYCRGLSLNDVREWYLDAFTPLNQP